MTASIDELLAAAEVAALTPAPQSTVRYWRHIGSVPASFRIGRRVVYRRDDVEQWLTRLRQEQARANAS
jgi:DNA-binding transcriptional MerR regulator